jgi:hypothetical protein
MRICWLVSEETFTAQNINLHKIEHQPSRGMKVWAKTFTPL